LSIRNGIVTLQDCSCAITRLSPLQGTILYTERCFSELFEEHDLVASIAYSCDDSFSEISLVVAGLGVGFAPELVLDLSYRSFELKTVRGAIIGLGSELPGRRRSRRLHAIASSTLPARLEGQGGTRGRCG
jgi:DNA-binding transcriptional LysR family regulator